MQRNRQDYLDFLFFLLIWFGGYMLFSLLALGLMEIRFGVSGMELIDYVAEHPEAILPLKLTQILTSVGIFLLPALVFAFIRTPDPLQFLGLKASMGIPKLFLALLITIAAAPMIYALISFNEAIPLPESLENIFGDLESAYEGMLEMILNMDSVGDLMINMFMIAVIPALAEEFLFRGTMQQLLAKAYNNPHLAIIITGMIFSLIHMQFSGFIPRMALGIMFGYIYYWGRSIWLPVFAHMLHNGVQVLAIYYYGMDLFETPDGGSAEIPWLYIIASVVATSGLLMLFYRMNQEEHASLSNS